MTDPGSVAVGGGLPVKELTSTLEKLGIFEKLKEKLFQQPDVAGAKLQAIFAELSRVLIVVDGELVSFLAATFDRSMKDDEINREKRRLARLTGPTLQNEIADGRTSCAKIKNIYKRHLRGWFSRVLNPEQSDDLRKTFVVLADYDGEMMKATEKLGGWLSSRAAVLEQLIEKRKWAEANRLVLASRKEAEPLRQKIDRLRRQLRAYEREAIEKVGIS